MPLVRLLLAGLVALAAMAAVLFTAVVVLFTGLAGFVAQLFRGRRDPVRPAPGPGRPARRTNLRTDDVIDVEATKVPDLPGGKAED